MSASLQRKHSLKIQTFSSLPDPYSSEPFPDPSNLSVIGVEATSYLQQIIDDPPSHEPLLAALGGDPIGLKQHLENELNRWKDNNMKPIFVFDGLNVVGKDDIVLDAAKVALQKTNHAWNLYGENAPAEAVTAFGQSGMSSYAIHFLALM